MKKMVFHVDGLNYEDILKKNFEMKEAGVSEKERAESFGWSTYEYRHNIRECYRAGQIYKKNVYRKLRNDGFSRDECAVFLKLNVSTLRAWDEKAGLE